MNILNNLPIGSGEFKLSWQNEPTKWIINEKGIEIYAPKLSNYFIDEEDPTYCCSAPFLHVNVIGDFEINNKNCIKFGKYV